MVVTGIIVVNTRVLETLFPSEREENTGEDVNKGVLFVDDGGGVAPLPLGAGPLVVEGSSESCRGR